MKLDFSNLHFDGEIRSKWDVMLRVVGDFSLSVAGQVLYREVEFCVVELAMALADWLTVVTDDGPDFVYTSLESETEGLVRFTRLAHNAWRVSSAHQQKEEAALLTRAELMTAVTEYIFQLRQALLPRLDIFDYVENENALRKIKGHTE